MRGVELRPGSSIEVNIDKDDKTDVWYPANLIKQVDPNSFLVKFQISKEAGCQKAVVDFSHIRPTPAGAYRKSYNLRDKVDAFYENGWWSGVVTNNLEGKRYLVCLDRTNMEEELRLADLRMHMEWSISNGRWFQSLPSGVAKHSFAESRRRPRRKHVLVSDIVNGTSDNKSGVLHHEHNGDMSPSQSANSGHHMEEEEHMKAVEMEKKHDEASKDHDIPNNGGVGQKEGEVISQKRKRGRPPKVYSRVNTPKTKEADGYEWRNNKMKGLESIGIPDVETIGVETSSNINDAHISLSEGMTSPTTVGQSEDEQDHNIKLIDGPTKEIAQVNKNEKTSSTYTNHENNSQEKQNETPILSNAITPFDVEDLPFIKVSQVWKMIESMEVFKQIPQKPHFNPLYEYKEECREGLAIGNMVTFASLVDRVPRLQFWDPRSVIEGYMEALNDLEAMGLNVGPVREKLNKLMGIKNREEMSLNTVKQIESQVLEREHEKLKLSEEIGEVDKKLHEFNQKRASLLTTRAMKEAEIGLLQSSKDGLKESLREIEDEFEKVAASFR